MRAAMLRRSYAEAIRGDMLDGSVVESGRC